MQEPGRATPQRAVEVGGGFRYAPQVRPSTSRFGFWLDAGRRRRGGRLALSTLTTALFLLGAGLFSYPLLTDLYTDRVVQDQLAQEFEQLQVDTTPDAWEPTLAAGSPLTRILVPDLDVDTIVVAGTTPAALRAGAGHYPDTPLPGTVGNVGIAGHRTTYGKPFNRLDELEVGDEIWLQTPVGDHRYVVTGPPTDGDCVAMPDSAACITHPRDWSVVAPSDDALLTLTTCHPKGSAAQRLVIRAALAESFPPGTRTPQDAAPSADV